MAFIIPHDLPDADLAETPVLAILDRVLPHRLVRTVIARHTHRVTRYRKLPGELVLLLLVAFYLVPPGSFDSALDALLAGIRLSRPERPLDPASASGITRARARWGVRPIIDLFREVCRPLASPTVAGAFLFGLRVMAFDSSKEDLADTPENVRVFGRHRGQNGDSAFPQLLGIYLLECGTRAIIDADFRPCHGSIHAAAQRLCRSVVAGMLVLWDCGFHSYVLAAQIVARQAQFLGRVPSGQTLIPIERLADGTYLARLYAAPPSRRSERTAFVLVRVLAYTIDDPARPGHGQAHRLMTTLLDPVAYPAEALICAYHERWEIEIALDEIDNHLKLARQPLHSKTPRGVIQEAYGLLLAHYAVRATLCETALRLGIDPDRVSFVHTVRLIRLTLPFFTFVPPAARPLLTEFLQAEIARHQLPPRRSRGGPRAVKRAKAKYRPKRRNGTGKMVQLHPFATVVTMLPPPASVDPLAPPLAACA